MNWDVFRGLQRFATGRWSGLGLLTKRLTMCITFYLPLACIINVNAFTSNPVNGKGGTTPITTSPAIVEVSPEQSPQWETPQSGWLYVLDYSHDYDTATDGGGEILLVDPQQALIKGRLKVGSAPEMILSPDGTRLYVASIGNKGDLLSIIDTASGAVIRTVPLHNRWHYTSMPETPTMAISQDGRWLYMLKLRIILEGNEKQWPRPHEDVYTVAVLDTSQGIFLTEEAEVSHCISGMLLPSDGQQVQVFCSGTNELHSLQLTPNGLRTFARSLALPFGNDRSRPSVSTSAASTNGSMFAIMSDARILEIDNNALKIVRSDANNQLSRRWVPSRNVPHSPDGKKLYIAAGNLSNRSTGLADEILVADTKTMQTVSTIRATLPFWSLVLSNDGRYLYAISPVTQSLLIIDTANYRELRTLKGIGRNPAWAVVAP